MKRLPIAVVGPDRERGRRGISPRHQTARSGRWQRWPAEGRKTGDVPIEELASLFRTDVPEHPLDVVLGRPGKNPVTASVLRKYFGSSGTLPPVSLVLDNHDGETGAPRRQASSTGKCRGQVIPTGAFREALPNTTT